MNRKVFIIGPGASHDYSDAERFGEVVKVLSSRVNPFRTDDLVSQVADSLKTMTAEDYVLPGGSVTLNAIAIAFIQEKFGHLKLLIYGAHQMTYVERDVDVLESQPA